MGKQMIIKLTDKEQKNLEIVHIGNRIFPKEYIKERDEYWDKASSDFSSKGKKVWNGKLYSFEGINEYDMDTPKIYLGEIMYSDRIFKNGKGIEYIEKKYSKENISIHCGVSIVMITTDNKFVVGKKKHDLKNRIGMYSHISGNLNVDELEVNCMKDIYKFAKKELEEESALKVDNTLLKFNHINIFNTYCSFDFIYKVPFDSTKVGLVNKDDEMLVYEALTLDEILDSKCKGISDFMFSKRYLKKIIAS